jgi:hypothetical protein
VPRTFLAVLLVTIGVARLTSGSASQAPTNQSPTNQSPAPERSGNQSAVNQSAPQPQDPAAVLFTTNTGLVLHAVKPASVNDYELAIVALREGLAKAEDAETQQLARAWRIYKASEADAKSSVIYVHVIDPVVPGVDYRPSLWLDKVLAGAPADLLAKYRDAFATPPAKLSLTELTKAMTEVKKQ